MTRIEIIYLYNIVYPTEYILQSLYLLLPQVQSGTWSEWSWLWWMLMTMYQNGAWFQLPTLLWFPLTPLQAHWSTSSLLRMVMKATMVKWSTSCLMVGFFFFCLLFLSLSFEYQILYAHKAIHYTWTVSVTWSVLWWVYTRGISPSLLTLNITLNTFT